MSVPAARRRALVVSMADYFGAGGGAAARPQAHLDPGMKVKAGQIACSMLDAIFPKPERWSLGRNADKIAHFVLDAVFDAMLVPGVVSHRPRETHTRRATLELIAAAVAAAVERGMSGRAASGEVARLARRRGVRRADGKPISSGTIYGWWRERRAADGCQAWVSVIVDCDVDTSRESALRAAAAVLDEFLKELAACASGDEAPALRKAAGC